MFRHIVLFKLKNPTQENLDGCRAMFETMRGRIEGMVDMQVGYDVLHSERSYDIALVCTFVDRAAQDAYQTHPLHQPVKAHMHQARESSVACDYEFEEAR